MNLLVHLSRALRWVFIIMTTIITTITTAITTNPNFALLGSCCRLSTFWSLQHRGKWCSYLAKLLDELPIKSDEHRNVSADWTWHILGSKLPFRIDTSTRRVEPWSKAIGTILWWSDYWDVDNWYTVEGYRLFCRWAILKRRRMTWSLPSRYNDCWCRCAWIAPR